MERTPAKHDLDFLRQEEHPRASAGQVLVMFAFFAAAMIGMLGMAVDLGVAFSQRRTVQNGADLGAIAGARIVAKNASTPGLVAQTDVQTVVSGNKMGAITPTIQSCQYVNDARTTLGACSGTVLSTATGVKVIVTETHPTYFIKVLSAFGAPSTVTTRGTAVANVMKLATIPSDGPFLVCGVNTQLDPSGSLSVMIKVNNVWQINPAAVNKTFKIHGPQIQKCASQSSRYKGLADQAANITKTAPPETWFNYDEGDKAGPVSADVQGAQGCKAGQDINNCVAFLPIVVNVPAETGNNRQLWCIGFAPFFITITGANTHSGKLLGSYIVRGPVTAGWTPGYLGPVVMKLTS